MKYLKHFANAQEAATILATWPFNTISSIEGQSGILYSEGVVSSVSEIWYTTTNGVAIDLEKWETLSYGNVNPISSTYSGGKGIVKFDGVLTTFGGYGGSDNFGTLQTVTLPDTITTIGDDCLAGCNALTSINIPDGVTTIGDYALSYTGLTSLNIPASVTSIGSGALYNPGGYLLSITVDFNNQYYDSRNNCNAIINSSTNTLIIGCRNSTIPNGVVKIKNEAFNGTPLSGDLIIPDSVTEIGDTAFMSCTGLTSVRIGTGITKIGADAFDYCSGLNSITVLALNPPTISSEGVFDSGNNCPIYVPSSVVDTYKAAARWSVYASRIQALPAE